MYEDFSVLGQGNYGCVIKSYNNVYKIGSTYNISEEAKILMLLPKNKHWYNNDNTNLSSITEEHYNFIEKNCDMEDFNPEIQLKIPFVKGETLDKYLEKYIDISTFVHNDLKDNVPISFNKWFDLLGALFRLYDNLKMLNEKYNIYHNDIFTNNLIYDEDDKLVTIIDFGLASIGEDEKSMEHKDLLCLLDIIRCIIINGTFNRIIYEFTIEKGILTTDDDLNDIISYTRSDIYLDKVFRLENSYENYFDLPEFFSINLLKFKYIFLD